MNGANTVKGILINTKARMISTLQLPSPDNLSALQEAVDGYIELLRVRVAGKDAMLVVNEEGLLRNDLDFFTIDGIKQPLAGNAVIVGIEDGNGCTTEEVQQMVKFHSGETIRRLFSSKTTKTTKNGSTIIKTEFSPD